MKLGPFRIPGYHVGDCRELLRQLPDGCINTVVTSPPYWALRDYGLPPVVWGGEPGCEHSWGEPLTMHKDGPHGDGVLFEGGRAVMEAQAAVKDVRCGEFCERCGAWRGQLGLEPDPDLFVDHLVEVFEEVRRVLRPDGTLWLNLGDSYAAGGLGGGGSFMAMRQTNGWGGKADRRGWRGPPAGLKPKDLVGIPWRVAFALQAAGWWLRSDNIWHKPNPMPEAVTDRPSKAHEYVFLLSKSERYHYDADAIRERMLAPESSTPDDVGRAFSRRRAAAAVVRQKETLPSAGGPSGGRNKRSVWTIATEPTKDAHFATFPRKLVEPCILAGAPLGGVVLDPFGGSGTVGRVAEDLGRRWLLFDLGEGYSRIAKRRTAQTGLLVRTARPAEEGAA